MSAAVLCLAANAQSNDSISRNHVLDDVKVVENARSTQLTSTAPLRILGQQDMLRLGVTDIADALHRLPGITLRDYGGAGGMKTVSVRGFGSKHTGVVYDGITLSECQSGEIDVSRYSLENVDNIALVVGDNDDIFIPARHAAYPALLSITTMRPPTEDTKPHLTAQMRIGSFGYTSPFLRYAQNINDRFALQVSGEYVYAENDYPYRLRNGIYTEHKTRTNSMMNSAHGEAGFIWKVGRNSRLDGKVFYYNNDRQLPGQARYYTDISLETLHDRNFFGQLQYRLWNSKNLSFKWQGKFNWASSDYKDGAYQGGINDAKYWQREAYTSACVLYTPIARLALDYSLDYSFNNLNSSLATDTRPYRHTVLQSATAKYTGRRLTAMARLLYSLYFNKTKDGASARNMRKLSPSLSIAYRLLQDEELYARASYKNIFRAPTFNESYYFHYGSTDLLPESTDQYNIGVTWKHTFAKRSTLNLTIDGYFNHVKDMIVAVPQTMFVWTNINVGKVKSHGIEATADWTHKFNERFTLLFSGSYTWQKCENRTNSESPYYGYQIAYTPEHQGSAAVSFENPWCNLSVHGHGISHRYTTNEHYDGTRVAGYFETGLTLYRKFSLCGGTLEPRLDIKNLLDKQYFIVAKYPMPGICYQFSINYKF